MAYKKKLFVLAVAIGSMAITACGSNTEDPTSSKGGETTISSSQKTTSGQQSTSQATPSNSSEIPSSSSAAPEKKKINLDLGDFVANVQDAKSLSIKNTRPFPKGLRKNAISEENDKPVLVKTSVEFADDGSVIDESGEVEVSFKKITTTVKTHELNGQESYIPYEEGTKIIKKEVYYVSFTTEINQYYHLFNDDNIAVAFGLKDNDSYDLDSTLGIIKVRVDEKGSLLLKKFYQYQDPTIVGGSPVEYIYPTTRKDEEPSETYNIEFKTTNDSVYEVYDKDGILIFDNIVDGGTEDKDSTPGSIKISGLEKSGNYSVRGYKTTDGQTVPSDVGNVITTTALEDVEVPDYALSFETNDGFDYKVCELDGEVIIDNLTDGSEKDLEEQEGVIKVNGLEKGKTYLVKYHGFGEETEVSQQSVGADIDKTYVYSSRFSFISFVPEGESKRPTGKDLVIDADGVALYDKEDYYSDDYHQSFLVDNYTGLVYKIENFKVVKIENRVLYGEDNKPYGFKINDNDELVIFKIVRNETIQYSDIFGDIFNQYYVRTGDFEGHDTEQNTMFYIDSTGSKYMLANSGLVLDMNKTVKIGLGFEEQKISDSDTIFFSQKYVGNKRYWKIEDGYLYSVYEGAMLPGGLGFAYSKSVLYYDSPSTPSTAPSKISNASYTFGGYPSGADQVRDYAIYVDVNTVLIYSKIAKVEMVDTPYGYQMPWYTYDDYYSLYYAYIWDIPEGDTKASTYCNEPNKEPTLQYFPAYENRVKLVENVKIDNEGSGTYSLSFDGYSDVLFKQVSFTETVYWKAVMDNGYLEIVNSSTYVAPENTSVIIQPINR